MLYNALLIRLKQLDIDFEYIDIDGIDCLGYFHLYKLALLNCNFVSV